MSQLNELLQRLSEAHGPPGYEDEVRRLIVAEAKRHADKIDTDSLGNVFAEIRGTQREPRIMVSAHMDEVGLVVTYVVDSGYLRFDAIGSVDPRILPGQLVALLAKEPRLGVIGTKPPHILTPEDSGKQTDIRGLYIDIGLASREKAQEIGIDVGTTGTFDAPFRHMGTSSLVVGKALDNRAGCTAALMLMESLAKKPPSATVVFAFTVQEEVGFRGASVAANRIGPDVALVFETAVAADHPDIRLEDRILVIGGGPAVRVLDSTMITQRPMLDFIRRTAENEEIPYQLQVNLRGGTDAGRIHISGQGVPTGVLSTPCRYIHTPSAMLSLEDLGNLMKLAEGVIRDVNTAERFSYKL